MPITLFSAMRSLNFAGTIAGASNDDLVNKVDKLIKKKPGKLRLPGHKALKPAPCLHGDQRVRAITALHRLAESSALNYPVGLYSWKLNWIFLKYLGFFDATPTAPEHKLSLLGRQVVGRERGVVSEELGIAFGLSVAELWCQGTLPGAAVEAIDIDQILSGGRQLKGAKVAKSRAIGRRADYLLQIQPAVGSRRLQFRILECKGTSYLSNVSGQLASAVGQLDGVEVGTIVPPGLAVATFTGGGHWSYEALDPEEGVVEVEVNARVAAMVREGVDLNPRVNGQALVLAEAPELLAARSLNVSMAKLAAFSGKTRVETQRPGSGISFVDSSRAASVETPVGNVHAVSDEFSIDGVEFRVFRGLEGSVNSSLAAEEPLRFLEAQASVAARVGENQASTDHEGGSLHGGWTDQFEEDGIWSLTSNGSVLGIVPF